MFSLLLPVDRGAIWKLEASVKCWSCKKGYFTEAREITQYLWAHPEDER
jgi:hypothetical protein